MISWIALLVLTAFAQDDSGAKPPAPDVVESSQSAPSGPLVESPTEKTINRVALVVGVGQYQHLPEGLYLSKAKANASRLAQVLQDDAHFNHVFLLTDAQATRSTVRALLREEIHPLLGPDDVFLFYFEGHGVGADLEMPTLLVNNSTLENGQEDGFEVGALARDLQTWATAGTALILTDAVHGQQLDGIYFYGPTAGDWPQMPQGTMVISAGQPQVAGEEGSFGALLASAFSGRADVNQDRALSTGELFTYLVTQMSATGHMPMTGGLFNARALLATGLTPPGLSLNGAAPVAGLAPDFTIDVIASEFAHPTVPAYPDFSLDKVKFVFKEGASPTVACRGAKIAACSPSCYVWDFRSGPCTIRAVFDGIEMNSEVMVLSRGKYDCGRKGGDLVCEGPFL